MIKPEITAIIVEDIREFHSVIETFLRDVAPHVKIVGHATTLAEAEKLIHELQPVLLFLDIQFEAEEKTAFDLLNKLSGQKKYNFHIIIITAFNQGEYYAEAFNFGALHFITKPIDKEKLKVAIERVDQNINSETPMEWVAQFQRFHEQLHASSVPEKIIIDGVNYTEVIQIKDIVYMEASGRYTYVYVNFNGAKPICSSVNIGEYERKLKVNSDFFRVHRNMIININYIQRFSKKDHSIILSPPYEKQFASKDRFKEFVKFMEEKNEL
jgi:two-component system LytT family response regulator